MVSSGGVRDLFAPPRTIAAASGEPGVLLLRSAEELGEYPVTVVHSLRAWATIAPNYPLVAERDRGGWRTDDGAGLAFSPPGATGDRGLAAVEPHVRRQPQREHDAQLRRHAVRQCHVTRSHQGKPATFGGCRAHAVECRQRKCWSWVLAVACSMAGRRRLAR